MRVTSCIGHEQAEAADNQEQADAGGGTPKEGSGTRNGEMRRTAERLDMEENDPQRRTQSIDPIQSTWPHWSTPQAPSIQKHDGHQQLSWDPLERRPESDAK
jgi:hypothetical protein